jgi:hypothetical protein
MSLRTSIRRREGFYIKAAGTAVGILNCYRVDGPRIKSWWGKISKHFQNDSGARPDPYTIGIGTFPEVK